MARCWWNALPLACLVLLLGMAHNASAGSAPAAAPVHGNDTAAAGQLHGAATGGVKLPPASVAYPFIFLFVALGIGCVVKVLLHTLLEKTGLRIPYSVALLSIGMILGTLAWEHENRVGHTDHKTATERPKPQGYYDAPKRTISEAWTLGITAWIDMSPRLILFIFLPALIFEGSLSTDFYVFRKQLFSGLLLAFPGMMVQIALIAVFAVYWFPFGWGWVESLLFGGILSATDPVAVIALMKELGRLPGGFLFIFLSSRKQRARVLSRTERSSPVSTVASGMAPVAVVSYPFAIEARGAEQLPRRSMWNVLGH